MGKLTKEQAVKQFKETYADLYINRVDYWTAQLVWTAYIDTLCKNNKITQKQLQTWKTPFPYGKHLIPTRKQLERKVYNND